MHVSFKELHKYVHFPFPIYFRGEEWAKHGQPARLSLAMLSDKQTEELRAILEAKKEHIEANARDAASFSRDRDVTRIGRDSIDGSAAEELFGTKLRLADRESLLLDTINRSLDRLAKGDHGLCEDCGEDIAFARLQARPMTTLCIPCQEDREES